MPWTPEDWEGLLEPRSRTAHPDAPNQALTEILQRIPDRGPMNVADFGCADGSRLSLLAATFGNVWAVGPTPSSLSAARAAASDDNVRHTTCDFSDLSAFARSIHVALAMDATRLLKGVTLDHLIEQLHGVLVEGGILLMTVPAAKRIGGPIELHLDRHPRRTAPACYHEVELQYRLRRAGFQGLRIRRFEASEGVEGTLLSMAVRRTIN